MKKLLLMLICVAACADDVPQGSLLERTRVLGVAARPDGDATRAWPRAGEETRLDWLVAGPGGLPPMSWEVAVCAADAHGCTAAPFYTGSGAGLPDVRFVAPDAADVARLLVLARVTPDGEPETTLAFDLPVEREATNHHPRAGAVTLGGAAWEEGCPTVAAGGEDIEVRVGTHGDDRESFVAADGTETRESLRLSFFATAGELAGQYRVVEAGDPDDSEAAVAWTPPAKDDVPDGGLRVRFTFVVRDLRGGIAWTERTLCVSK